ncbi:BEM_HP_G0071720.mRNA.1.CDS.1 [Saccharomyces cerevisiae]|nr:BEM_HP_G0150170.mRNA.1.CDS.1 [Saccharomyces cerevisiae]CAI5128708.1 BEM_HP_G0071720.mRNA.1.CDS.1 [Saccharomyces cerevisiae]CAI6668236.1 BEM_HP_G0150170.mRNA.1.CDS.1 [Saccharomyces cerevisiae]CAI6983820.1 BEM_HP_G0071720.mRNA.1.CDS.1 [Saccharomyces cerevisiae]
MSSSLSQTSKYQATSVVNGLLSNLLPGVPKIRANNGKTSVNNGSKAQLIDRNLKKRVQLQNRDVHKIKKKCKLVKKKQVKKHKLDKEQLEQLAKHQVLKKHQHEGTLTDHERKYLNKLIKRNSQNLRSWDLEGEVRDELEDIQQSILMDTVSTANTDRSKRRRFKRKQFKEDIKESDFVKDHRYPGLTPGLAPVGLSDEEDSSEED